MYYMQKVMKECFHSKSSGLLLFALLFLCLIPFVGNRKGTEDAGKEKHDPPFALGVVDLEQDSYTELLLEYFEQDDAFSSYVSMEKGTEEEITRRFAEGELDGWIRIPEDFVPAMIRIEHVPLVITLSTEDTTKAVLLQNLFQSYGYYVSAVETGCMTLYRQMEQGGQALEQKELNEMLDSANWQISLELIMTALGRSDFFEYVEVAAGDDVPLWAYYLFSLLGVVPFLMVLSGGVGVIEEKRKGILMRIRIAGGFGQWMSSRILVYGVLASLGVLVPGSLLRIALGRKWLAVGEVLSVIVVCVLLTTLMLLLAYRMEHKREYLLAMGMLVLLLAMFGGSFLPVRLLPDAMASVAEVLPNRYLAGILMR